MPLLDQINDLAILDLPSVLHPETLMPGHRPLAEGAESRCRALHAAGIGRGSDLSAAAVDPGLLALARSTKVPADWLERLCGLVEHHRYRPVSLAKVPGLPPSLRAFLAPSEIRRSDALIGVLRTPADRHSLASAAGVDPAAIEECAAILDLTRKPGIKEVKARLFLAAGLRSLRRLGSQEPHALRTRLEAMIAASGMPRGVPTPMEVQSDFAWARIYPLIIEF